MSENKLIEYTNIKKTADGLHPLKHEALFKISGIKLKIEIRKSNKDGYIFSIPENNLGKDDIEFAKKRLIQDWERKEEILFETNKKSLEVTGMSVSEFRKQLSS